MSSAENLTEPMSGRYMNSSDNCLNSPDCNDVNHLSAKSNKPWERSQSAVDLKNNTKYHSSSVEYSEGSVSEQSKVYWDLSQMDEEAAEAAKHSGGKFKISLQTIHQKEQMSSNSTPSLSIQTRFIKRMGSQPETVYQASDFHKDFPEMASSSPNSPTIDFSLPPPPRRTSTSKAELKFSFSQGKQNFTVNLDNAVPLLRENIVNLRAPVIQDQTQALDQILHLIEEAWATPTIGHDLAYKLCDVLRTDGGLDILIENCENENSEIVLGSARVLEQSMIANNREEVVNKGLDIIVNLANSSKHHTGITTAVTGILDNLFTHSQNTCEKVINLGGLDSILYSCRNVDLLILRNCAEALANLALYGGKSNQKAMIQHKAADWLFPLAFSNDDSIRYYALIAVATLCANVEIESAVVKSGTLDLIKPFILSHDPFDFGRSDKTHIHGQNKDWLRRLIPVMYCKREEAQSIAAFHFAMEASLKVEQGRREIFAEICAIEPLKRLATSTNKLASKFATQALEIIGEQIPYVLSTQVPLWSKADVIHWFQQIGFSNYENHIESLDIDGDILLKLDEANLEHDIGMTNGITRMRFIKELRRLKSTADYDSCDHTKLDLWLTELDSNLSQYSYAFIQNGVDKRNIRFLTDENMKNDIGIANGVHRMKIVEAAKRLPGSWYGQIGDEISDMDKPIDVFISYRRSNGSQLASLLKVHLQLKGFTVFLDIEKLRAGKFDDNLLNSVRNARNFVLVLTPEALDRCIGDKDLKDWVHKEIVTAIECGCNIIPVLDNFQWPVMEELPEDMRPICYFNGIRWNHDYQDACIDKCAKFMNGDLMPISSNLSSQRCSLCSAGSELPIHS